jgi:hypothetical protein
LAGYEYGIRALHNTVADLAVRSESQDILQLTQSTFVTSEVDGELIFLITVAKPVVRQMVRGDELLDGKTEVSKGCY